jgi:hypothetical protein
LTSHALQSRFHRPNAAKACVLLLVTALVLLAAGARGAAAAPSPIPRSTTVTLDTVAISTQVHSAAGNFWCSSNDYGAIFANYTGQCPYQDFVASVHWKKVPNVTEYDVCLRALFQGSGPGFACWTIPAPKAGNPATLSTTFDSAGMSLNAFQGTTQLFMVKACNLDPVTHQGMCSESEPVSFDIPWTG